MKVCPRCGYDLTGLPVVHRCPECGIDYDPYMKVITLPVRRREYRQLKYGVILLLMVGHYAYSTGVGEDVYVLFGLVIAAMLPAIYRLSTESSGWHYLIIDKGGIRVDSTALGARTIPWQSIGKAKYGWLTGKFLVYARDGTHLLTHQNNRLGSPRLARRCAAEINRLKDVYSQMCVKSDGRDESKGGRPGVTCKR